MIHQYLSFHVYAIFKSTIHHFLMQIYAYW